MTRFFDGDEAVEGVVAVVKRLVANLFGDQVAGSVVAVAGLGDES
jgi:hypothetical protein